MEGITIRERRIILVTVAVRYLEVPEEFIMNLTIDELFLESSGLNCTFDWVMIYDGHSTEGVRSYGKYCGRIDRFTIYGTTKKMMITAHTDGEIGKKGFRAVYQVTIPRTTHFSYCNIG